MENLLFLGVPILKHIRVDPPEAPYDETPLLDLRCSLIELNLFLPLEVIYTYI